MAATTHMLVSWPAASELGNLADSWTVMRSQLAAEESDQVRSELTMALHAALAAA